MDVKLDSGRIANRRARYRNLEGARRQLSSRGIAPDDVQFLAVANVKWVYWYEAR